MLVHTGFSGILHRTFHNAAVKIISLNVHLHIPQDCILCLGDCLIPHLLWHNILPVLCGKFPVHTRCNIRTDHSCLNWKCSTSTKRINQNTIFIPRGQHNKRCRQRLGNRRLANQLTISTLMQRHTRRIQCNGNNILQYKDPDRILSSVLFKPVNMINALQPIHNCFLYNRLNIRPGE